MVKKRMILMLAAALCLMLTAGCGKAFEVAGDILSLSVADTGKDEEDSYSSADEEELPARSCLQPRQRRPLRPPRRLRRWFTAPLR